MCIKLTEINDAPIFRFCGQFHKGVLPKLVVVWFSNNEDRGFKNNFDLLHNAGTQRGPNDLALSGATKAGVPCKKAASYIYHSQQARKFQKYPGKKNS